MKKKNSVPTGLIIGIILALLAFLLSSQIIKRLEPITVDYYVAAVDIDDGDIITSVSDYFVTVSVPEYVTIQNAIPVYGEFTTVIDGTEQTVSASEYLTNQEVYFPIAKGDFDIYNKLTENIPSHLRNLSDDLPSDRRLLPIETDAIQSFGGSLKSGDRVDLTFTYEIERENIHGLEETYQVSVTALQGILVHDVIYEAGVKEQLESGEVIAPNGYALSMIPEQVEAFNFFSQNGNYSLTLNSSNPVEYHTDGFDIESVTSGKLKDLYFNIEQNSGNNNQDNDNQDDDNDYYEDEYDEYDEYEEYDEYDGDYDY